MARITLIAVVRILLSKLVVFFLLHILVRGHLSVGEISIGSFIPRTFIHNGHLSDQSTR